MTHAHPHTLPHTTNLTERVLRVRFCLPAYPFLRSFFLQITTGTTKTDTAPSRHDDRRDRDRGDRDRDRDRYERRDRDRGYDRDRYRRDDDRRSGRHDGGRGYRREREERPRARRDDEMQVDGPPKADRGDRDRGRGQKRGRDGMGTPERRSPTPTDAVPLSMRKRKASGWDVHAPGYEAYSAMQAKQTGMSCAVSTTSAPLNIFDRSVQPPWC
jgi:hypothetical protein